MIRSFTKALSVLVLSAATFSACKKDKDDDGLAVTKENLAGSYTLVSSKVKISGLGEQDAASFLESCEKDDHYVLATDFSFKYVDTGSVCSSNGSYESTWELKDKHVE